VLSGGVSAQRTFEETPRRGVVPPHGQQHIDDLAILIDRPVEIGSPASDLQVGLVGPVRHHTKEEAGGPARCEWWPLDAVIGRAPRGHQRW
jgi:hypothetical protein